MACNYDFLYIFAPEIENEKLKKIKAMKKTIILLFALFVQLAALAQLKNGHFFKSLRSENLTEERAVERFGQWFALPQETEWRRVDEHTDKLGMTRVEYRQYVGGVEVEHSQVLLHIRDGRVQTANGTVMEIRQAPAKARSFARVYRGATPTDLLGQKLYLVSTGDGYRYATKVLSADGNEWIYTDADTGEVLKRIPTHYSLTADPVKVTGSTIYSGEVQMDASYDSRSGSYMLWDQQRNIHTMIGTTLPSIDEMLEGHSLVANFPELAAKLPVPEDEMTDEMWEEWEDTVDCGWTTLGMTNYIDRNALYASSTEPKFDSYVLNTLTIDRLFSKDDKGNLTEIIPAEDNPLTLKTEIYCRATDGMIERTENTVTSFPFTLDLKNYHDEIPADGADIVFYAVVKDGTSEKGDSIDKDLTYISLCPDDSGYKAWIYDDVKASATYGKGPWSAADIHWGMQYTYDFYLKNFGRDSYDGKGAPIYNLFYLSDKSVDYLIYTPMNNAMAMFYGTPQMVYRMGSRGEYGMFPVVELSVMAHEFTHMVTKATAKLVYEGESGALNESFSDLMGISVKKYVEGNDASWTIAEGVMENFSSMRCMSFPKTNLDGNKPGPDTYQGEFWIDPESFSDYGGIHTNSGVQNKWYYLLTDGDSGINDNGYSYQVDGIGIEKSQQIAYRTLTEYATQESQYADIRLASLQAAEDLFGEYAPEVVAVDEAWKAVGVGGGGDPTAIRNIEHTTQPSTVPSVYDLTGRKVQNPQKGLYIINGKKTVVE